MWRIERITANAVMSLWQIGLGWPSRHGLFGPHNVHGPGMIKVGP